MDLQRLRRLDGMFRQLLEALRCDFTDSEKSTVERYVNADEYVLALEITIDIMREDNKLVTPGAWEIITRLADLMELSLPTDFNRSQYVRG